MRLGPLPGSSERAQAGPVRRHVLGVLDDLEVPRVAASAMRAEVAETARRVVTAVIDFPADRDRAMGVDPRESVSPVGDSAEADVAIALCRRARPGPAGVRPAGLVDS